MATNGVKLGVIGIDHGHIVGMLHHMMAQGCTWGDGRLITAPRPYFGRLITDIADRTETAVSQAHTFTVMELAIEAHMKADQMHAPGEI